ncbi:dynein regulatory complex subunit 4 [Neocloeon triangulifer]|uniref:dynein regulatory complex subunit 4 n=1 Tax=Neocloeon triangulifer TaxID=2078957 RepID=UPI00286F6882|nr:dynein regulatory complex subunit 4 [Neocloeon triangulifer]
MVDSVGTAEMTKEQLEAHANRLRLEMEREREERNFFQLERDKIQIFWDITRQQLEEKLAESRNKDREIEEAEEAHQNEIKILKQHLQNITYEQQLKLTELQAESMVALKLEQDKYIEREEQLMQNKRDLQHLLKEHEISAQDRIRKLKLAHSEELSKLNEEHEMKLNIFEEKAQKRLDVVRAELRLWSSKELAQLEQSKDQEMVSIRLKQEQALDNMKEYYKNVIASNMALISNLKMELSDAHKKESRLEQQLIKAKAEDLSGPLKSAQLQLEEFSKQFANYEKDKELLEKTWQRHKLLQRKYNDLRREHNDVEVHRDHLEAEVRKLRERLAFLESEKHKGVGLVSLVQEHKLKTISSQLEVREAQLNQILSSCHADPAEAMASCKKLEDLLKKKEAAISRLQFELAKACKAHNQMLSTFEGRFQEFGLTCKDLDLSPLKPGPFCPAIRSGPSTLSANTNQ